MMEKNSHIKFADDTIQGLTGSVLKDQGYDCKWPCQVGEKPWIFMVKPWKILYWVRWLVNTQSLTAM